MRVLSSGTVISLVRVHFEGPQVHLFVGAVLSGPRSTCSKLSFTWEMLLELKSCERLSLTRAGLKMPHGAGACDAEL